jgi:hypothetical protein
MERHRLRQFAIAERLAGEREFDRELLIACGATADTSEAGVTTARG